MNIYELASWNKTDKSFLEVCLNLITEINKACYFLSKSKYNSGQKYWGIRYLYRIDEWFQFDQAMRLNLMVLMDHRIDQPPKPKNILHPD